MARSWYIYGKFISIGIDREAVGLQFIMYQALRL